MAWDITTQSDISELTLALTESALASLQNESLFAPGGYLHQMMWVKHLPKGSKSDQFNRHTGFTAGSVTDGVDYAASNKLNPSGTAVTATEMICIGTVTDYADAGSIDDLGTAAGRECGFAMANKWDTDAMALFEALNSATCVGTSGTDTYLSNIDDAITLLFEAKHGGPIVGVIHPRMWKHIMQQTTLTIGSNTGGGGALLEAVTRTYWLYTLPLHGCQIVVSNNVPATADGADHCGAVLSGDPAIGCTIQQHPSGRLWNNIVAIQRDESFRASEIVVTTSKGVAEIDDTAGIPWKGDYEL